MAKEKRHISEQKFCYYCGKDTSTFCGYWRLTSTELFREKRHHALAMNYAHVGCFIEHHRRLLQLGIIPSAISCVKIDRVDRAVELFKIHGNIRKLKNTIKFLQKVLEKVEKK